MRTVEYFSETDEEYKLFLKLIFAAFEDRFKRNLFDDEENEWESEEN